MTPSQTATRLKEIQAAGPQNRSAIIPANGINAEARTVELAFSSETESVERWFGIEVLGHAPGEVNLARLVNGAPLLWCHDHSDQRGVVVSARIDGDRKGRAIVQFSRSPEGNKLLQDIVDGIVTKVSVGYSIDALELVGERDDTPIYRITSWTPHEISMVSVPADDTVGVGRTLEVPAVATRAAPVPAPAQTPQPRKSDQMLQFRHAFTSAKNAPGDIVSFHPEGTVRGVHKRTPAFVDDFDIRTLNLSAALSGEGRVTILPPGTKAGQVLTFLEVLTANSLFAQLGGQILIPPEKKQLLSIPGVGIGWYREMLDVVHVGPSRFQTLVDGEDAQLSAAPIARVAAEREWLPNYAVHHKLTNAEQKEFKEGQLADTVGLAVALGAARLIDEIAFKKIRTPSQPGTSIARSEAADLPPVETFSLARAAAAGHAFGNLRAVVGTDGVGAQIDAGGTLRVNGIEAALTDTIAESIVGDFSRSAIAIAPRMTLTVERMNRHREINLVGMISAEALVPVPSSFFRGV